ncbi:hypothetical protein [Streptomyces sp. A1-5]|uniref:hypothetical protein n=1 Tax=Streptomyces sp. A1-5 TaxID=2738410 RepID=UPI001F3F47AA|nr:hypothetical protein [Streptomyces sp. A1-5]
MFGKTSKDRPHFVCYRDDVHHRNADWFDQHPKSLWASQKILLEAVHRFFGERLLGPHRGEPLRAQLTAALPAAGADEAEKAEQLRKQEHQQSTDLIDLLPRLGTSIAALPEPDQRRLYDAFQLEVRYHRPRREIQLQATVPAATAGELSALTRQAIAPLTGNREGEGTDQPCFGRPRQDSNLRPSA